MASIPAGHLINVAESTTYNNTLQSDSNTLSARTPVIADACFREQRSDVPMGNSLTFHIPPQHIVGLTFLRLRVLRDELGPFPSPYAADHGSNGAPRGWGYSAISYVEMSFGSGARYRIEGRALFVQSIMQCDDQNRSNDLMALGGDPIDRLTSIPNPDSRPEFHEAIVHLALPFSSLSKCYMGYDTRALGKPITITVQLAESRQVFIQGVGTASTPPLPSKLASVEFVVHRMAAVSPSIGPGAATSLGGGARYAYSSLTPLIYCDSAKYAPSVAPPALDICGQKRFEIVSIQAGNIVGLTAYWVRDDIPAAGAAANVYNPPIQAFKPRNLSVEYLGQCIYDAQAGQLESCFYDLAFSRGSSKYSTALQFAGTTTDKPSQMAQVYFSQSPHVGDVSSCVGGMRQLRVGVEPSPGSSLTVRFDEPLLQDVLPGETAAPAGAQYRMFVVLWYQTAVLSKEGQSALLFKSI